MFSSSAFKELSHNTSLYQQQTIYDLNSLLNDSSSTTISYGIDNFDLSLLGSDYSFDNEINVLPPATSSALSIEIDASYTCTYPVTQFKQEEPDWSNQNYYLQSSSLISPISPATTTYSSPSPCPSIEYTTIKQEYPLLLPPSPPDSNGVPSPQSIHCDNFKVEQFDDGYQPSVLSPSAGESFIDINYFLESDKKQDHQVLRSFLQDTSFQRKHNLKPLPLENLFGGLSQRGDIEPVISLALQHAKQEVQATCNALNISPNPYDWTEQQVQLWINWTVKQFRLEPVRKSEIVFPENGQMFAMLNDDDFMERAPQIGSILHAQLEIWKAAYIDVDNNNPLTSTGGISAVQNNSLSQTSVWNQMLDEDSDMSDEDDSETVMEIDMQQAPLTVVEGVVIKSEGGEASTSSPLTVATTTPAKKVPKKHPSHLKKGNGSQSSHIHLWQFLKELLASPQIHGTAIRWLDRSKGIFKIEDSVRVARLWGRRKNRPAMNYDKLSRSIRQYYKKGIMKKTERSQRLVYQFCHPYSL